MTITLELVKLLRNISFFNGAHLITKDINETKKQACKELSDRFWFFFCQHILQSYYKSWGHLNNDTLEQSLNQSINKDTSTVSVWI